MHIKCDEMRANKWTINVLNGKYCKNKEFSLSLLGIYSNAQIIKIVYINNTFNTILAFVRKEGED